MTDPDFIALLEPRLRELAAGNSWNKSLVLWRNLVKPSSILTSVELDRRLDASLWKWPYFTLLKNGEEPPSSTYTQSRDVIEKIKAGFPDAAKIRRQMSSGSSLKLNQVADWHRPSRRITELLARLFPVTVSSYAFWTPEERAGMLPHRDYAHVLVFQLEGAKEWHLYAKEEYVTAEGGLHAPESPPTHTFTLHPGDVLYFPHGWPHDAIARNGSSLHLTFTMAEPTAADFVDEAIARLMKRQPDLFRRHHARTLAEKTHEVCLGLEAVVNELTSAEWLAAAVDTARSKA